MKTQKRSSSPRQRSKVKAGSRAYTASITVPKRKEMDYVKVLGIQREQKRSGIGITEKKECLEISITAKDITALRASMNSIIRDLQVIEGALQGTE
jgi:tRNA threonylcarbamoyladenosine modification (KEOPS) complex  Pcc1 subunit